MPRTGMLGKLMQIPKGKVNEMVAAMGVAGAERACGIYQWSFTLITQGKQKQVHRVTRDKILAGHAKLTASGALAKPEPSNGIGTLSERVAALAVEIEAAQTKPAEEPECHAENTIVDLGEVLIARLGTVDSCLGSIEAKLDRLLADLGVE